jgi:hypothetical protein
MKKKPQHPATQAWYELLRTLPESVVLHDLRTALNRALVWHQLHGKKFKMPTANGRKTKTK